MAETRSGIVIAVGNQKGGVGKTTNAVHIAAALGERGHKVLLIDLDPAAGATKHLGIKPTDYAGSFELLQRDDPDPRALAVHEKWMPQNVDLIPSRQELAEVNSPQYLSKFADEKTLLQKGLARAREEWDIIILDTPPNPSSFLTLNAYNFAEWFLISSFPHALSLYGVNDALADIADVRNQRNPNLEVLGVVVCKVDGRTKAWQDVEKQVSAAFPGRAFSTHISQAEALAEAPGRGKTVFEIPKYKKAKVVEQYRDLAEQIEERIQNREEFLATGKLRTPRPRPVANTDTHEAAAAGNQ